MAQHITHGLQAIAEAKASARRLHQAVYVRGDEVFTAKPKGQVLMVWPNGSVTLGTSVTAASRDLERRHMPAA